MRVSITDGDNFYEIRFASAASVIRVLHREGHEEFVRVHSVKEADGASSRPATLRDLKDLVRRHAAHADAHRQHDAQLSRIKHLTSFTNWLNTPERSAITHA